MREVVCIGLALFLVFAFGFSSVYAADSWMSDGLEMVETEFDVPEDVSPAPELEEESLSLEDIYNLLNDRIPYGFSTVAADVQVSAGEEEEIPPMHALHGGESAVFSLRSQVDYPYTGGSFIAVNTSQGDGIIAIPENYKVNTFGFIKGTDRVVNLTASTVSGYWITGNNTYSLRFSSYGEAQYRPGNTYDWVDLDIQSLTDTNIQFLDETGERGLQIPYFPLESKILLAFVFLEIFVHFISFLRGGS